MRSQRTTARKTRIFRCLLFTRNRHSRPIRFGLFFFLIRATSLELRHGIFQHRVYVRKAFGSQVPVFGTGITVFSANLPQEHES